MLLGDGDAQGAEGGKVRCDAPQDPAADMLQCLNGNTRLCIAANLTCEDQFICTRRIADWKQHPVTIGKRPCVFLILA